MIINFDNSTNSLIISNQVLKDTFSHQFLPLAITATLLAPLNRLKIILQTNRLLSINEREKVYKPYALSAKILKEQGLFAFWRGNLANVYKQLIISYANIFINHKIQKFENLNFFHKLFTSCLSTSLILLLAYPFELSGTRMTADMTRYGHTKLYSSSLEVFRKLFEEENISRNRLFTRFSICNLYKGFTVNLISGIIYWNTTLNLFDRLQNYFNKKKQSDNFQYYFFFKKMIIIFGATSFCSILATSIVYPFDTFKRHLQVNESLGYKSEYSKEGLIQAFKKFIRNEGIKGVYAGFSCNLLKILPFSMIHYTLFIYSYGGENI